MDVKEEITMRAAKIDEILKQYLPAEQGYQKTVIEAMNYSILAGGKRLRPMLMQETYRMFGGKSDVYQKLPVPLPLKVLEHAYPQHNQ